ncbi:hypothetical protein ABTL13_19500, partial [Acinetobacter baumannii]
AAPRWGNAREGAHGGIDTVDVAEGNAQRSARLPHPLDELLHRPGNIDQLDDRRVDTLKRISIAAYEHTAITAAQPKVCIATDAPT